MNLQELKMPEAIVTSLAREISDVFDVRESLANAILTPYVLEYNRSTTDKIGELEETLKIDSLSKAYQQINGAMGVPSTFENVMEVEITEQKFLAVVDKMSADVAVDPCTAKNPRVITKEDVRKIYECAFYGNLAFVI